MVEKLFTYKLSGKRVNYKIERRYVYYSGYLLFPHGNKK